MGTSVRKVLKNKRLLWLLAYVIFFVALAWYFLYMKNADTMYFLQDRGWWNSTSLFFKDCISVPGGMLAWAGSFLTQIFYYPALGCLLLILLWLLTFGLAKYSFKVPGEWSFLLFIPLAALLCSIIQLGYWVYLLKDVDYVFYHSLGLFAALLLSLPFWRYLLVKEEIRGRVALLWIPLVAALFYYPLGFYALLAAVLATIQAAFSLSKGKSNYFSAFFLPVFLLVLTLWLVPLLETSGTTLMRPDQPWTYGFHKFELDTLRDYSLEIPFYVAILAPVFFPFIRLIKVKKLWQSQGIMFLVALAMLLCLSKRNFKDYNFHAELRMQRAVEECRWNDVLREAALAKGPVTREMIMFRDIALINRGELCTKRYIYNNESILPATVSDSIHIRIADQAADLIYYNYGETIFGIRRAMERCMHYGYSYYTMRMLAQCALVNGEKDNVKKYLRILSRTTFQKKWADEMKRFVCDERLFLTDNRFRMPFKLYNEGSELVGVDDKYVELTILNKWMYSLTNDPEAQEVALGCAMIMRNSKCFWSQVQQYYNINQGKSFPTHVQEAMLYEVYALNFQGVNLSFVKFDERVLERYKAFISKVKQYQSQGMDDKQIGSLLRSEFCDTYMWDYYVLREVQTN
ncbi:MAG: hypothetical protein IKM68_03925 [Bacteroidaceae bacterium]|nr:hypothetical protein [Bacteroidaceae bacterium]